jgi:hypothetical protein
VTPTPVESAASISPKAAGALRKVGLLSRAVAETIALFGAISWAYVAAIAERRPQSLSQPISVVLHVRSDTFGIAAFLSSFVAFASLQVTDALAKHSRRRHPTQPVD